MWPPAPNRIDTFFRASIFLSRVRLLFQRRAAGERFDFLNGFASRGRPGGRPDCPEVSREFPGFGMAGPWMNELDSLTATNPKRHPQPDGSVVANTLYGMTDQGVDAIAAFAKSWTESPTLKVVAGEGIKNLGYDAGQRAYVLELPENSAPRPIELRASAGLPTINPAFVIRNCPVKRRR